MGLWSSIFSVEVDAPSAVPATVWTRLHAIWTAVWAILVTVFVGGTGLAIYLVRTRPRIYSRWLRRWGRTICWGIGVRIDQRGAVPKDSGGPLILVANHQCALDISVHAAVIDRPFGYLAKEALRHTPLFGFFLRKIPTVFVDRRTPRRAKRSLQDAAERIESGQTVLIYPEGERTFAPEMAPFLRGAFVLAIQSGVPVVPVVLTDAYRLMDERALRSRPGTVHVRILDAIPTDGRDGNEMEELQAEVRAAMEDALGEDA